ncbi:MAG: hypothetical protein A2Y17_00620 [Clostridiales bacterium GWF2_38_85]|nr:MAG: hypothetical protein A2Y17_00620 [Clostridiales bacterium GWF2_38_85]
MIKKLLIVLLCLILSISTCFNAICLINDDTITAQMTYNDNTKTIYVNGTATCPQVVIKINKMNDPVPVSYSYVDTIDNKYQFQKLCSLLLENDYIVYIANIDNGMEIIKYFSTVDEENLVEEINIIINYASTKNAYRLTIDQLEKIKLYNIDDDYLIYYKNAIENSTISDVDTRDKIQILINNVNSEHSIDNENLSALINYNFNNKTINIVGKSSDPQVIIKITESTETTPLLYKYTNVQNGNFEINIPWSIYDKNDFLITIENINNGAILTKEFKNYDMTPPL